MFNYLNKSWGPHSIDRFASNLNKKCNRFNSRWWCPGTEAVDTFSQNWAKECNWLVPPPRLILKTLNKMQKDKAKGTLVVPMWRSAPFWPFLISDEKMFKKFVV